MMIDFTDTNNTMDTYFEEVHQEFTKLENDQKSKKKDGTSCKDVLQFLVDNYKEKNWWWSWEFVGKTTSKGGYLSHRAPARASDLALHTDLVEDRKIGRFKVYRVRRENREKVLEYLK